MFEKILIATDFSPASDCLIDCSAELRAFGVKKVVLAHVVDTAYTRGLEEANSKKLEDMFKAQAPAHLVVQKRRLEEQGSEVETALEFGIPARDLNSLAARHDVSAILIGSHGHGLITQATLGSVSFRLLQGARRPVLLSRIKVTDGCNISVCGNLFSRILFATDFSDAAERAFGYVENIAREFKSEITLMHVFGRNYSDIPLTESGKKKQKEHDQWRMEEKKERLETMQMRLNALGSRVSINWKTGTPTKEIVARSVGGKFTMIIMGNHGKGFFREAFLGSVANDVVRHAEVPVLLIPSAEAMAGEEARS